MAGKDGRCRQTETPRPRRRDTGVPKVNGADVELGSCVDGVPGRGSTGLLAAKAVLMQISGVPHRRDEYSRGTLGRPNGGWAYTPCRDDDAFDDDRWGWAGTPIVGACHSAWCGSSTGVLGPVGVYDGGGSYDPQDVGRKFLAANGGCAYIDLTHLELCIPEVVSAFDHVAAWHAMLRIARDAMRRANAELPEGRRIHLFANNSDGQGNSWGSHCNFLLTRACFDRIFNTKMHHLLYLATYLVSSIIFTGAGKVGSESGADADYQVSSRTDFFECLTSTQTTYNRPIVNRRDESLCGPYRPSGSEETLDRKLARLHVIFFDSTLCQVATLLKVGVTQIILAMLESQVLQPHLILDNPLAALKGFSCDPDLRVRARLVSGRKLTAIELQSAICTQAEEFVAAGRASQTVPHAQEIVTTWRETLEQLRNRDWSVLAGKLDWVLKRCILERAIDLRRLRWLSPEIRYLDHMYSSLDADEGLYWKYEADVVRKVVPDALIERFTGEPPADTRAWLRAEILRRVDPANIVRVDWDEFLFSLPRTDTDRGRLFRDYTLPMHDPLRFTRTQCQHLLEREGSLRDVLAALGTREDVATAGSLDRRDEKTGTAQVRAVVPYGKRHCADAGPSSGGRPGTTDRER